MCISHHSSLTREQGAARHILATKIVHWLLSPLRPQVRPLHLQHIRRGSRVDPKGAWYTLYYPLLGWFPHCRKASFIRLRTSPHIYAAYLPTTWIRHCRRKDRRTCHHPRIPRYPTGYREAQNAPARGQTSCTKSTAATMANNQENYEKRTSLPHWIPVFHSQSHSSREGKKIIYCSFLLLWASIILDTANTTI